MVLMAAQTISLPRPIVNVYHFNYQHVSPFTVRGIVSPFRDPHIANRS